MKALHNYIPAVLIVGALVFLAVALFVPRDATPAFSASFPTAPAFTAASTTATFSITTSARILSTTTNPLGIPGETSFTRAYAVICNPNANPVWLNFDADKPANASTGNATVVIAAAAGYPACFELSDDRMIYNGSVTASSTSQAATPITVKQYVY